MNARIRSAAPAIAAPIAAAFFLSGFAALIYELLWFRLLAHVFGSTATATATLLAAYLFGLGIGAWLFGRLSDRLTARTLLRTYVVIEAAIGLCGIASHLLLARGAALYELSYDWAAASAGRLLFTRFAISFVLVAVPTTLMGGTFPLMVHLLRVRAVDVGRATGRAYAVNTAGAAAGTLLLPAWLLPGFGVVLSLVIAAVANFAAAGLAWWHGRRVPSRIATDESVPRVGRAAAAAAATRNESALTRGAGAALLIGFFLSSFAALALETVWTRHLALFFGAQTFTFAFVLFGYLVGLFLGGGLYARLVAKGGAPASILRAGLFVAALAVALPLPFLDRLPLPQIELLLRFGISNRNFLVTSGVVIVALVLLPALGFGLVFPAVVDLLSRSGGRIGRSVGLAYVVNTVGTTVGSLAAGFLLVPQLGTQRTLEVAVVLLAAALALSWIAGLERARRTVALLRFGVPALFVVVLVLPRWDWTLAHAEYSKDPVVFLDRYRDGTLWPAIRDYRLAYFKEGTEATVSVCEFGGGMKSLFINGKPDASNLPDDMVAQRLLACIPCMFHPAPKSALVIGVGSGTTVATLLRFPLESIDAAEISPEVGEAARTQFADVNDHFGDDPRVHLRLDDGRSFLHHRPPASYDVIISEPSNPWMAGVSALFTDEFFADVKTKLRPGGIVCQWFHYYNMSIDHIRLLTRTFARHFPDACLFVLRGERPTGDLLLIGANGPLRLARLPEDPALPEAVRAALADVQNPGTQQIVGGLIVAPETLARFAGAGAINTDDRPILEFEAPADRFSSNFMEALGTLLTANERGSLAAGPSPEESPSAVELARDGFALPHGLPDGRETWRGVTVISRSHPDSDEVSRFVLVGRRFESDEGSTELYRLAGTLKRAGDEADLLAALAGAGTTSTSNFEVGGHSGHAVAVDRDAFRTVAIGWSCPKLGREFFVVHRERRGPVSIAMPEQFVWLAERFSCAHAGR